MIAARTGRIADASCGTNRLSDRVGSGDVWARFSAANRNRHRRSHDVDAAADDMALCDELIDRPGRQDDAVKGLAGGDLFRRVDAAHGFDDDIHGGPRGGKRRHEIAEQAARGHRRDDADHYFLIGPVYCSIGGVPWVWNVSIVFRPQA